MYTSKADPGPARRDRAPGFEIPGSATVDLGPIYNVPQTNLDVYLQ